MLHKKVKHITDKKVCIMLFLMDYNHKKFCDKKIFGDEYIKTKRYPEPLTLGEIFHIISNQDDLDEEDPRLFIIQEILDFVDIEIVEKEKYTELEFLSIDEEFDDTLFDEDEMKTITKIVNDYKDVSARKIANDTFKIDLVREKENGEVII